MISAERRRLTLALLLSLLIHTLLLSLTFGDQGFGLPAFGFLWRERRIEVPNLRVELVPARVTAAEPPSKLRQQASIARARAGGPALTSSASSASLPRRTARTIVPKSKPKATAQAEPKPDVATAAIPAKAPSHTEGSGDAVPTPIPEPVVIAMEQPDEATLVVPAAPSAPTPVIAVAPNDSSPETVMPAPRDPGEVAQKRAEPEVQERAVEVAKRDPPEHETYRQPAQPEAARPEVAQQETARRDAARMEAARLEAERQEIARLAAAQLEATRQEAARRDAARIEAARLETERQEAARQAAQLEAQRQEAARRDAARIEAAQLEAQRQEAARREAARIEAARLAAEQEEDAIREARRRAIGRQLDEEAAQRDAASAAASAPSMLPLSLSTARRVRLWGRTHANQELIQYAEAWARKIQLNTPVDMVRNVTKRPHADAMVTVAIRSDGSVESVTFVLSSGVTEVDEAILRIVQSHAPYQAFPPGLAREFDVVEVRRTWYFDTAIRLY